MELFHHLFPAFRAFLDAREATRLWRTDGLHSWPAGGNRNIVLADEMAVELGNPSTESFSVILWTEDLERIRDGAITLIGPDIPESRMASLPYGKIVLLGGSGFDAENTCRRFSDLEGVKYDVDLRGFMLRALSRYRSEWCRVGLDAWEAGFSLEILGSELIRLFREKPYIHAAEIVFVTSGRTDVRELRETLTEVDGIIGALSRMEADMSFDCSTCDYQSVCDSISGLRAMHESMRARKGK